MKTPSGLECLKIYNSSLHIQGKLYNLGIWSHNHKELKETQAYPLKIPLRIGYQSLYVLKPIQKMQRRTLQIIRIHFHDTPK